MAQALQRSTPAPEGRVAALPSERNASAFDAGASASERNASAFDAGASASERNASAFDAGASASERDALACDAGASGREWKPYEDRAKLPASPAVTTTPALGAAAFARAFHASTALRCSADVNTTDS